jgi:hypothetical protein
MPFRPTGYGNYFVSRLPAALLLVFAVMLWSMRMRAVAGLAIPRALVLAFLFGVLLLAVSCGGGSTSTTTGPPPPPPPTPTNYSITVKGTSGSLSQTTTVILTVNP